MKKIKIVLAITLLALSSCVLAAKDLAQIPLYAHPVKNGYIDVAGGKLYFQSFGAGMPMIVLHGGPGLDQSYLLPQMLELSNYNLVTFYDQRGSGRSLGFELSPATINMDQFVNDLDAVRAYLGYDKFILLGHSWGGLLAMRYAITYPQHVSKLVLFDSAPANAAGFKVFIDEYNKRIEPYMPALSEIEQSATFQQYDPTAVVDFYRTVFKVYFYKPANEAKLNLNFLSESAKSGFAVGDIFGENYFNNYNLNNELRNLKIPTLIVHGEQDIVPLATAMEINNLIPNSKLVVIKQSDHFPYIEQPKEFFAALKKFLSSRKDVNLN